MKIETAKKVYTQAPSWYKEVLEDEFGKEKLIKREFTDIKTFEDACLLQGTTEKKFNERFGNLGLDEDTVAYERLKIEIAAINNDPSFPNWEDRKQEKWEILFRLPSGFGFSSSYYFCDTSTTAAGSRLCFKSKSHAVHAFETFNSDFKKFIIK